MPTLTMSIKDLRKELRVSMGDRNRLIKLHSVLTECINRAYGAEKKELLDFRKEVTNAINCRLLDHW